MSSRQMRRLQQLVTAFTGADGDEEEGNDSLAPATIKPRSGKSKKSKKHSALREHEPACAQRNEDGIRESSQKKRAVTSATNPTSAAITAKADSATANARASATNEHSAEKKGVESDAVRQQGQQTVQRERQQQERKDQRRARKAAQAAQRRRQEAEEEALLDATLAANAGDAGDAHAASTAAGAGGGSGNDSSGGCNSHVAQALLLVELMTRADVSRLDSRTERIRNFGAEAVEDVGDGTGPKCRVDGQRRDTGSNSFFPEHGRRFAFRRCPLATANRYRWPPYDSLGMALQVVAYTDVPKDSREAMVVTPDPTESAPMLFALDTNSSAFRRADDARALCAALFAPVQQLVNCLGLHGCYHLPTLLQLSQTFATMGQSAHAQELIDLALYQTGMLLSRFRLEGTWWQRQLPSALGANCLLLSVLGKGLHVALSRGCTRTAWEMAKLLLSLDPTDPQSALSQLDYAALRAKQWVWLVRVHALAHRCLADDVDAVAHKADGRVSDEATYNACNTLLAELRGHLGKRAPLVLSRKALACTLALDVVRLPGFAFSAALARHLLAQEASREAESALTNRTASGGGDGSGGSGRAYRSKVLRDMTPAERAELEAACDAATLLRTAMTTFPVAAFLLVEALQGVETVCRGSEGGVDVYWTLEVVQTARTRIRAAETEGDTGASMEVHEAKLFVARHRDMWRAPETLSFLRAVLTAQRRLDNRGNHGKKMISSSTAAAETGEGPSPLAASFAAVAVANRTLVGAEAFSFRRRMTLTESDVLGQPASVIPAELLGPDADDAGGNGDNHGGRQLMEQAPDWQHMADEWETEDEDEDEDEGGSEGECSDYDIDDDSARDYREPLSEHSSSPGDI